MLLVILNLATGSDGGCPIPDCLTSYGLLIEFDVNWDGFDPR
jgi:hypothetical protein